MDEQRARDVLARVVRTLRERDEKNQIDLGGRTTVWRIESGHAGVSVKVLRRAEKRLRQPAGMFDAILAGDQTFIAELPDFDENFKRTILRWMTEADELSNLLAMPPERAQDTLRAMQRQRPGDRTTRIVSAYKDAVSKTDDDVSKLG